MSNTDLSAAHSSRAFDELLNEIQLATPRSLSSVQKAALNSFLPLYFHSVPTDDLSELGADDLNGAALSHWELCQQRQIGSHKLRIFNPVFTSHGWQSPHTVVELVAEDQAHLVSSLRAALVRAGYSIHLIVHPIVAIGRDKSGCLTAVSSAEHSAANNESLIHIQMDRMADVELQVVHDLLSDVLLTLKVMRRDQQAMQQRLQSISESQANNEQTIFLEWLAERQFAAIGMAEFVMASASKLSPEALHALGIFDGDSGAPQWPVASLIPDESLLALAETKESLLFCKATQHAPVIRDEPADLILILHRDADLKIVRITCLLGLFVPGLQNENTESIPWLHERLTSVLDTSSVSTDSHDGKALAGVLRGFPRDMLLQTQTAELLHMATGIITLHERQQIRLFGSTEPLGRLCHCLVYIPRDTYSRELRLDIESILLSHIDAISTEFHMRFSSESALARLYFIVQKKPPLTREINWRAIEQQIRSAAITWDDHLLNTLNDQHEEATALALYRRYRQGFSSNYREDYSARVAVADIGFIEHELTTEAPVMSFYRHILADTGSINFKLFSKPNPIPLSDVIPVIENMGLRVESEHPFEIKRREDTSVWIHEFTVQHSGNSALDAASSAQHIQQAFSHIWQGAVENDGFNRLILEAGLNWRHVVVLRSYCKYLLQIGVPFSQSYMIDSLVANPHLSHMIVELFEARFDPALQTHDTAEIETRILASLEDIHSLDEDRILRAYLKLVLATLRTNFYCLDSSANPLAYVSFKFDSRTVPDLPLPQPMVEIFVYSPRVEGIHLRGGSVARGGLRWSDRREDFRTEVLGLMKAQMVKNAVIVPVGSKGGFFVKMPASADRETTLNDAINCYRTFLRGLLDITDNIVGDCVVGPANVVRHDDDDPYLVVAADKGTATFSDYANALSKDYNFWLGDAFASGGSAGYDHKKMGITARGAWESVKRHFRQLGHDIQQQPLSVVGIGDMAGDVFGNGMLLSNQIRLIAAFNHQHIFIDPDPQCQTSLLERRRLFVLPRSSWQDYNQDLLSEGGGIYSRQDKKITLSLQAQQALGTSQNTFTPTELISVVLKAPVDLLWNGGIGTYIKAAGETQSDAADRANDSLRIDACNLRCRVVGEGGNLGLTQRGRIEFASNGGLIYTDAIDNSAGVDCSDHEVNIKILLNAIVAADDMTVKQRDTLLVDMTDDVANLVLRDNYLQTQCIDLSHTDGHAALSEQSRFMQHLESIGRLNRDIEFLPGSEEIADLLASDQGLSRPQLAVLVSYSKMVMYDDLLDGKLADDAALMHVLHDYFPPVLGQRFADKISGHRLRQDIIATQVTNDFVNRLGPTFAFRMHEELGATATNVATAFVAVRSIFQLPSLWDKIDALDNSVTSEVQNQMLILVRGLVERSTQWLLRSRRSQQNIQALIDQFEPAISRLIDTMPECLGSANRDTLDQRLQFFTAEGVPADIAQEVAQVVPLSSSLDIVEIAASVEQPVGDVAAVYFELGKHLELQWLRERIGELRAATHWHTLAKSELRRDLHYQQRHLCAEAISSGSESVAAVERVANWSQENRVAVNKYSEMMIDMKASAAIDFTMLSLAVNEVHKLLRSDRPLAVQ